MAGALIKLTDAGRAALVGPGNVGTVTRTVVSIGIATAPFEHNNGLTVLPNERAPRITALAGKNIAADTIHVTMRDDSTDQYTMYGFGLYLDNGVLLGTYSQPTPIVEKSSLSWMVTSADIQFATIDAAAIVFGDASFINPPATTEVLGVVELATGDEAQLGIDSTRVVTPAGLRRFGSQFGGVSALNANTDLSPWYSGRAIQWFGPDGGVLRLPSGSSVPTGGVFYIYNQGAGALVIGLVSQSDFFWTTASRTTITLQRGENVVIVSRGTTEYDVAGGTASAKYVPRTLVNLTTDDGQNALQVGGGLRVEGTTLFGNQAGSGWANADANAAYFYGPKNVAVGAANASGVLDLVAGNGTRVRVQPTGRVLVGTLSDDGVSLLQVNGQLRNYGEVQSAGTSNSFRIAQGNYGVFLRNDGGSAYLMQTASGDQYGTYNNYRPFFWNLSTGAVAIDDSGAGTSFGGDVKIKRAAGEGHIMLGQNDGYWYGNPSEVGWYSPTKGQIAYKFADKKFYVDGNPVWNSGSLPNPAQTTGFMLSGGGITAPTNGENNITNAPDASSRLTVTNQDVTGTGGGAAYMTFLRNGQFACHFGVDADNSLRIGGWSMGAVSRRIWHEGILPNPLDKSGGQMTGQLLLAEGTPSSPSLSFANDGAPDTGLYHINDGSFGVSCNGVGQVRFTPGLTVFDTNVQGPTQAAGTNNGLLASTAFVTTAMLNAQVGQVVIESRATTRAGYLKANGVLLNRADYPALWAYAQSSGALSTEANWAAGWHGTYSTGDGATTFRIPDLRGEFLRFWDDSRGADVGRGVGSYQAAQNMSHSHGASSVAVGDHSHGAWTDAQGWHGHHGNTYGAGGHAHNYEVPPQASDPDGQGAASGASWLALDGYAWRATQGVGDHAHVFDTDGAGTHSHNVGVGNAGAHSHTITVSADGGTEVRTRNIALLAMIRAF